MSTMKLPCKGYHDTVQALLYHSHSCIEPSTQHTFNDAQQLTLKLRRIQEHASQITES